MCACKHRNKTKYHIIVLNSSKSSQETASRKRPRKDRLRSISFCTSSTLQVITRRLKVERVRNLLLRNMDKKKGKKRNQHIPRQYEKIIACSFIDCLSSRAHQHGIVEGAAGSFCRSTDLLPSSLRLHGPLCAHPAHLLIDFHIRALRFESAPIPLPLFSLLE